MIDLISKNIDEINSNIQKYMPLLEVLPHREQPIMAYIIPIAMNHIQTNYITLNKDVKACTIVILNKLLTRINDDDDIKKIIDEFFEYYNIEFKTFVHELYPISSSENIINEFMYRFINKKIGK